MKLEEIQKIEIGQIYKDKNNHNFIIDNFGRINIYNDKNEYLKTLFNFECEDCKRILKTNEYSKLTGFLNITHKIENNKLVELPRKEFEVETNDIIIQSIHIDVDCSTDSGVGCQMNDYREIIAVDKYEYLDFNGKYIPELSGVDVLNKNYKGDGVFTKIGIYGITHTFENDKLIKE